MSCSHKFVLRSQCQHVLLLVAYADHEVAGEAAADSCTSSVGSEQWQQKNQVSCSSCAAAAVTGLHIPGLEHQTQLCSGGGIKLELCDLLWSSGSENISQLMVLQMEPKLLMVWDTAGNQ